MQDFFTQVFKNFFLNIKSLQGRSFAGLEREFAFLLFKCDEGKVFVSLKIKGGIALAKLN